MSDTSNVDSGVETPDRFMMGIDDTPEDEAKYDQAIQDAFGIESTAPDAETTPDDEEETQAEELEEESQEESDDATPPGEQQGTESSDVDFGALFAQRYNRAPTAEELQGLIDLADWASSLTPEQQQAINQALAGPTPQPQPQPQPQLSEPDPLEEQYGDDPLYLRIKQLEDQQRQVYAQQAEEAQRQAVVQLNQGLEVFKSSYAHLQDSDLEALQSAVAQSGILPGFVSANNNNVQLAMQKALEYAYWQTPSYREAEIQRRMEAERAAQQQHDTRKKKAASVTGTGGNGASRTEPPKGQDPWSLVTAGIRDAMNNGEPEN